MNRDGFYMKMLQEDFTEVTVSALETKECVGDVRQWVGQGVFGEKAGYALLVWLEGQHNLAGKGPGHWGFSTGAFDYILWNKRKSFGEFSSGLSWLDLCFGKRPL